MNNRIRNARLSCRKLLGGAAVTAGLLGGGLIGMPAIARAGRPVITHGVQTGDVTQSRAIIWSRADRPSRMIVEVAATESFNNPRRIVGPAALEASDFATKMDLTGLPAGEDVFYRVSYQNLSDLAATCARRRGTVATSISSGPATRPGRVGASTKPGAG